MIRPFKRSFLCLSFLLAGLWGFAQPQSITLSLKNATLEKAFREVEATVAQRFVYTSEMLQQGRPVSLTVRNATLPEVLNLVFQNQPLQFSVDDRFIKVSFKPAAQASANGLTVQGRVLNENGEALDNATVAVKDKNSATITDAEGRFSIQNLESTDILVVSNVGYTKTEVKVTAGNGLLTVRLLLSVTPLDETVVIAYGTTTNRLNTGNVTKVENPLKLTT